MKALIGIDLNERWVPAVDMFTRLNFLNPEATLLHSLEWQSPGGIFPPIQVEASRFSQRQQTAKDACAKASQRLREAHIDSHVYTDEGDPVRNLIHRADEMKADLIVTGSASKGAFGSLFFGSVGKGLTIGARQSILIGKTPIDHAGPLTAVLATDHSPYVGRCIDRLIQLKPQGIGRLIVMTANEVDKPATTSLLVYDVPAMGEEAIAWVRGRLTERNNEVCDLLKPLGARCEGRIVSTDPISAIHSTMTELKADLLILGAQGHGFIERLMVGSISLYEIIAEPFNTLVLRSPS